ncbi:LOW QUALITY PROTEIN: electron transfer flavoprotein beta subunit lysine methyltransferase [Emydura macquarii macquarii]|uniref:LOW QUALITY PROTEIN: electron transfer flavoprotein beta subunit lysine methyltransferase n=1 Tax=Emydura macquarii macquarii TaxID=1129001 RepID=UPI00352A6A7A
MHGASRAGHEPDDLTVLVHVKQEIEARHMPFAIHSNNTSCKKISDKDKFTWQIETPGLSYHSNNRGIAIYCCYKQKPLLNWFPTPLPTHLKISLPSAAALNSHQEGFYQRGGMVFCCWKWFICFGSRDVLTRASRNSVRSTSLLGRCCYHRTSGSFLNPEMRAFLEENTEVSSSGHLTPEIRLRLLTPRCRFWEERADLWPYGDPFWAIYWPGGQALSRYILDNPDVVRMGSILDLGSGCGATAIAAVMSGASQVLANDIDPIAGMAMVLNCELNNVTPFPIITKNVIDTELDNWDLIVLGDMFYDEQLADSLHQWLRKCIRTHGTKVLIGDPGRPQFLGHSIHSQLHKVVEYSLPETSRQENNGYISTIVWRYQP